MDNHLIGYFRLGDQVRGEAAQAVHELQVQTREKPQKKKDTN